MDFREQRKSITRNTNLLYGTQDKLHVNVDGGVKVIC